MPEPLRIEFKGPLSWMAPDDESSVLYSQVAKKSGLYVWTAKTDKGYKIFYVGETTLNFSTRMSQHLEKQLSGRYHFYDAEALARGNKKIGWKGMYGRNSNKMIKDYLEKISELMPKNIEFIRNIYFFVAPVKLPKRMLERIEASIAEKLRVPQEGADSFLDRFITRSRRPGEVPVDVIIQSPSELVGLPDSLVV